MNRTRICMVTTSFPRKENDHAGRFLLDLKEELEPYVEIRVIAPDDILCNDDLPGVARFRYWYPRRYQRLAYGDGIMQNLKRNPALWIQLPSFLARMGESIREACRDCDLLLAHWLVPSAWLSIRAAIHQEIIGLAHGGDIRLLKVMPGGRRLAAQMVRGLSRVVFVSNPLKDCFMDLLNARDKAHAEAISRVIPMGCGKMDRAPGVESGTGVMKVVYSGRLIRQKGIRQLMEAMTGIESIELHIAGEGSEKSSLEETARRLKISVRFHGWLGRSDYFRLLTSCHAAVFPYQDTGPAEEGCPVAVKEAMAAGLVVISVPTGGIQDFLIHEKNGILLDKGDSTSIRQALLRLRSDDGLKTRLSQSAVAASRGWDWPAAVDRFREMFKEVGCELPA